MSEFKLSRRSLDKLEGVDDRLVAVVKHAITVTKTDFGVIHHYKKNSRVFRGAANKQNRRNSI